MWVVGNFLDIVCCIGVEDEYMFEIVVNLLWGWFYFFLGSSYLGVIYVYCDVFCLVIVIGGV